jgi:AraC-like DNA-binding protein
LLLGDFTEHNFGENNLISLSKERKQELTAICMAFHQAALEKDSLEEYALSLRFLSILRAKNTITNYDNDNAPPLLQKILSDINLHFVEIKSLDYITEKYFLSYSTLQRMFKKYLHTTPKLYIETKRLAYSRMLLKQGYTVFDACMRAGFSDYSNYIRLFRTRFNMTPKHYQEKE